MHGWQCIIIWDENTAREAEAGCFYKVENNRLAAEWKSRPVSCKQLYKGRLGVDCEFIDDTCME